MFASVFVWLCVLCGCVCVCCVVLCVCVCYVCAVLSLSSLLATAALPCEALTGEVRFQLLYPCSESSDLVAQLNSHSEMGVFFVLQSVY